MSRSATPAIRPAVSWIRIGSLLLAIASFFACSEKGAAAANGSRALTPPRGWNSYDSFSWIISEAEFLDNARVVSDKLLRFGYEYVVVDFLWYRKRERGASVSSPGFDVIDEWGRPIPDPVRWPSSAGGGGFEPVANRVHQMGLKFGIHVMRGISTQAVKANTPVMGAEGLPYEENGRIWRARDIALSKQTCGWMPACFMSVDTNLGAGRAFLASLYRQYAQWGADFVKHDCIFGDDLSVAEVSAVSQILKEFDRPILYSLSPGTHATPRMAMQINGLVNMYRVTADDWDTWRDVQLHFDVARDFAASGLIGAKGLLGQSWPDLDMLPLGWLTDPGVNQGPHRFCGLTLDEQKTQVTLWAMVKSPLMFGGDLRNIDDTTMSLITNPTLLDINAYSTNNKEFPLISFTRATAYPRLKGGASSIDAFGEGAKLLTLYDCKKKNSKNWSLRTSNQKRNQVCWNGTLALRDESDPCLHWRTQPNASLELKITCDEYHSRGQIPMDNRQGQARVLTSIIEDICLDSTPNSPSTFGHIKSNHFAPCNGHASQNWELRSNGVLLNSYSRRCAIVSNLEVINRVDQARAWVANGPTGEFYVGFFNLGLNTLRISTKVEYVLKSLHANNMKAKNIEGGVEYDYEQRCACFEVWSGQHFGVIDTIVVDVARHGSALVILRCT